MHFVLNWTSKGNIICEHSRTVQEKWLMLFSIVYQKLRKHVSWFRRKFKKLSIFGFSYGCNGERYIKIFRRKKRYKVILGLNLFFRSHILFIEKKCRYLRLAFCNHDFTRLSSRNGNWLSIFLHDIFFKDLNYRKRNDVIHSITWKPEFTIISYIKCLINWKKCEILHLNSLYVPI